MATGRRRLQFSLRGFFVLLTLFALWLGLVIVPNREQRRAVNAIQMGGGVVIYDWQGDPSQWKQFGGYHLEPDHGRGGNQLLTYLFGDEAFQDVYAVVLNRTSIGWQQRTPGSPILIDSSAANESWADGVRSMVPTMQRLSKLKKVFLEGTEAQRLCKDMAAALPHCEIILDSGQTALAPYDPAHRHSGR
jgi:hypothetical protein